MIFSDNVGMFVEILYLLGEIAAFAGFFRKIFGASKGKVCFFVILLFCFNIGNQMLYVRYYHAHLAFRMFEHIIFICLVLFLFHADREKKILAVSILMIVQRFAGDFFSSLFSCAALCFLHVIKKEAQPVLGANTVYCYINYFLTCGIVIGIILYLAKHCSRIFEDKIKKWYIITAVPLFLLVFVSDIAVWGAERGIMLRSGGDWGLYYDQLFSYGGTCAFSLLSILAAWFYVFGMHRIYLEQKEKECYYAQIMAYQMLERQYQKTERVRHDLKNHIIALQGLLEKKEWENMRSYLGQLKKDADMEAGEEVTGNSAIDALLSQKRKLAEEKNISWECDMRISAECPIDTYDFCVLLGNAIDNAIEACERIADREARFLIMYAKTVKKCFLFEIRNSTDMRDIRELEHSRKRNPKEHGLGLLNIRDVVEQYHGTMNVEIKENLFTLSILIPISLSVPDAAYDGKPTV